MGSMILNRSILLKRTHTFCWKAVLKEIRPGERVLEIGTGSGYIAAALKEVADVIATDINPHAVYAAKQNGVEVVRSDLADGLRGSV